MDESTGNTKVKRQILPASTYRSQLVAHEVKGSWFYGLECRELQNVEGAEGRAVQCVVQPFDQCLQFGKLRHIRSLVAS
jgi:hypothetical protein